MRRNEPWWPAVYLPCVGALGLLFMCVFFQVAGYWLSGGEDVALLIKENIPLYLKMAGAGFILGVVLWFFNMR
jgi:hypothetical protein